MFDALLGKKFTNKCKHAIKCIAVRMGPIKRKKQAMLRFLRKDVADLIRGGLDTNAFGRMDALIVEMNHAACYDMIEKFCERVRIELPLMQKQRECPREAMEAASTLIFAAARFSDLPELCDLRHLFTERYGCDVESSVSPEFIEKMQSKTFPMEKKLRLMQDIAQELSITWDHRAFEKKMSDYPPSVSDSPKEGIPPSIAEIEPSYINSERKEVDNHMDGEEIQFKGRFKATPRSITPKQVQPSYSTNEEKEVDNNLGSEEIQFNGRSKPSPRSITQKQVQPSYSTNEEKEVDNNMGSEEIQFNGKFEPSPRSITQKQVRPSYSTNEGKEVDNNMGSEEIQLNRRFKAAAKSIMQKQIQPSYSTNETPKCTTPKQVQPSYSTNEGEKVDNNMGSEVIQHNQRFKAAAKSIIQKQIPPSYSTNERKEVGNNVGNEENQFKGRFKATPKGTTQKLVQPEVRGVPIVSGIGNIRLHDHAEKDRNVFINEPENVEPFSRNAIVPPYVMPKGNENESGKGYRLKEGIDSYKSPWTKMRPGMAGLSRGVVESDRADANMVTSNTNSNVHKAATHAEEHIEDVVEYRTSVVAEMVDSRKKERQPAAKVNSNYGRAFSMIPPPYVKPNVNLDRASSMIPPPYIKPKVNLSERCNIGEPEEICRNALLGVERTEPISVRRQTKPQGVNETESAIDNRETVKQTFSCRSRQGGQWSAPIYDDDGDNRILLGVERTEPISVRRRTKPQAVNVTGSAIDNGESVKQTFSRQSRREGQWSPPIYDDDGDNSVLLGVERIEPITVRRRTKPQAVNEIESTIDNGKFVKQTFSRPNGQEAGQWSNPVYDDDDDDRGNNERGRDRGPEIPARNELDRAIDGGYHLDRIQSSGRRHGSRQITNATYDGDCEEDEEEIVMNRLLRHYSKKGMDTEYQRTRTRTRVSATEQVDESAAHHGHNKAHL